MVKGELYHIGQQVPHGGNLLLYKRESPNTIKRDYMMNGLPLLFPQRTSISIPQKRENPVIPIIKWDNRALPEGTKCTETKQ